MLKHLEQVSKWEPGKKEREKRERLAALERNQVRTFVANFLHSHAKKIILLPVHLISIFRKHTFSAYLEHSETILER